MQTRNTIQRQIVLQAVNQMHNHPTADAIYAVIAAQHPTISKAHGLPQSEPAGRTGRDFARACADRCRSL